VRAAALHSIARHSPHVVAPQFTEPGAQHFRGASGREDQEAQRHRSHIRQPFKFRHQRRKLVERKCCEMAFFRDPALRRKRMSKPAFPAYRVICRLIAETVRGCVIEDRLEPPSHARRGLRVGLPDGLQNREDMLCGHFRHSRTLPVDRYRNIHDRP
jgi:hypothetical protein